jgi:hypothetical protein
MGHNRAGMGNGGLLFEKLSPVILGRLLLGLWRFCGEGMNLRAFRTGNPVRICEIF